MATGSFVLSDTVLYLIEVISMKYFVKNYANTKNLRGNILQ